MNLRGDECVGHTGRFGGGGVILLKEKVRVIQRGHIGKRNKEMQCDPAGLSSGS